MPHEHRWIPVAASVFVISLATGTYIWYLKTLAPPPIEADVASSPAAAPIGSERPASSATLGGTIYEKANNPVKGELPATIAPLPNLIGGAYRNPFE